MRTSRNRLGGALLLAALAPAAPAAAGCGEALVGDGYLGTPVLRLSGQVTVLPGTPEPVAPQLSLFWLGYDTSDLSRSSIEQRVEVENRFPAAFTMAILGPPPAAAMPYHEPDDPAARVGVAFLAVYADLNDNGVMNSESFVARGPDMLIGASHRHVLVHATRAIQEDSVTASLLGVSLPAGYSLLVSDARSGGSCGYGEDLRCQGEATLSAAPPEDALELQITGRPEAVLLPKPADFVAALSQEMPSTVPP